MTKRVFLHVDLDAFFASVELIDNPALSGLPVIIGALPGNRGVVSTCSYEARKFGVHSGMPISEAFRLCPQASFLPVRMKRYTEISDAVMTALGSFTPDLLQISIDEASLDMTGTERLWGDPCSAAETIQSKIKNEIGVTCSIGIASNRYIAKIASDLKKPQGLVCVETDTEERFIQSLPLAKLWGAGKKSRERFDELGIRSIAQLGKMKQELLEDLFGRAFGKFLYLASRGFDPGIYQERRGRESISAEETFEVDLVHMEILETHLLMLSEEVMERLYRQNMSAETVTVKLRYENFITVSAQKKLQHPVFNCSELYETACALFKKKWNGQAVRLLGIGVCSLAEPEAKEQFLFEEEEYKKAKAEKTAFAIKERGLGKLVRARDLIIDKQKDDTRKRD